MTLSQDLENICTNVDNTYFDNKTVVVTGGAGFIGSWMCDALIKMGANVICLDNFSSGKIENITHHLSNNHFSLIENSVETSDNLFPEKIDVLFHLASRAGPLEFAQHPIEIIKSNTIGTINMLEIAKANNARFIYTSTSEIYGNPTIFPTPETYFGNTNPCGPRSCYDESKRCGETIVLAYHNQYNVDVRIARIFNTYGPRIRDDGIYGRVIPRFINQALSGEPITIFGTGAQTRCFNYITDTVISLLRLASSNNIDGTIVNIGNTNEITIKYLAKIICSICGRNENYSYYSLMEDDPTRRIPDTSKMKKIINWISHIPIEEGIQKMLDYQKNRMRLVKSKSEHNGKN